MTTAVQAPLAKADHRVIWRDGNALHLHAHLDRLRLLLRRRSLWVRERWGVRSARTSDVVDDSQLDAALAESSEAEEAAFFSASPDVLALDRRIVAAELELEAAAQEMSRAQSAPAIDVLQRVFRLSTFERDVVLFALAAEMDGAFERAFAYAHDDLRRGFATVRLALETLCAPGSERLAMRDAFLPERPLRRARILECAQWDATVPMSQRCLQLDDRITDFLRGVDRLDERLGRFLRPLPPPFLPEEHESVAEEVSDCLAAPRTSWIVVNLLGDVDRGARDVAAAACELVSATAYEIDVPRLAAEPPAAQSDLLSLLGRDALLSRLVYLADANDADSSGLERRTLTELAERLAAPLIVVSREAWSAAVDVSVARMPALSRAAQAELWARALSASDATMLPAVSEVVQQFDFGPPRIARAAAVAHDRARRRGTPASLADIWDACREQHGTALDDVARRIEPSSAWRDIVLPDSALTQLHDLATQVRQRSRVYETWGFGEQLRRGRGVTALFAGASGTGKTMAAEVLANELRLDLYRVDLSSVVSKWVGDTEKKLRLVFDAAEERGVIVLFDEADALFTARTDVRDSHDRYANLEVNYLLQRMEDYTGLAILATNRRSALDEGFIRRLRFVVDFPFPDVDHRRRIWEQVFPERTATVGLDHAALARLELSGGNIRAIAVAAAFLAAGDDEPVGMRHVMRAAAREYAKLRKVIAASEFGAYYEEMRL